MNFAWYFLNRGINVFNRRRDDTFLHLMIKVAKHCMCFSTPGLSICKHCWVKASHKVLNHLFADRIINFLLFYWRLKYMIVCKKVILTQYLFLIDNGYFLVDFALVFKWVEKGFLWSESDKSFDVELWKPRGLHLLGEAEVIDGLVDLRLWTVSGTYLKGCFGSGVFQAKPVDVSLFGLILIVVFRKCW